MDFNKLTRVHDIAVCCLTWVGNAHTWAYANAMFLASSEFQYHGGWTRINQICFLFPLLRAVRLVLCLHFGELTAHCWPVTVSFIFSLLCLNSFCYTFYLSLQEFRGNLSGKSTLARISREERLMCKWMVSWVRKLILYNYECSTVLDIPFTWC